MNIYFFAGRSAFFYLCVYLYYRVAGYTQSLTKRDILSYGTGKTPIPHGVDINMLTYDNTALRIAVWEDNVEAA